MVRQALRLRRHRHHRLHRPPKTCAPLWTATAAAPSDCLQPAVANGSLYIGSNGGKLYAFNATGTTGCSGPPRPATPVDRPANGTTPTLRPAVANGMVYIGSDDGSLYAFDATGTTGCTGSPKTCPPLWTASTGSTIGSSPAVANGMVYVGSGDALLYAINATTGAIAWTSDVITRGDGIGSFGIESSPTVANGVVYVGSDDGNHVRAQRGRTALPVPARRLLRGVERRYRWFGPLLAPRSPTASSTSGPTTTSSWPTTRPAGPTAR